MSADRSGKSHAVAWVLSILAVPVLYVLTLPMVLVVTIKSSTRTPASIFQEPWFVAYAAPFGWLRKTSLKGPLDAYFEWAVEALGEFKI